MNCCRTGSRDRSRCRSPDTNRRTGAPSANPTSVEPRRNESSASRRKSVVGIVDRIADPGQRRPAGHEHTDGAYCLFHPDTHRGDPPWRNSAIPLFRRQASSPLFRSSTATADIVRSYFPDCAIPSAKPFVGATDSPVGRPGNRAWLPETRGRPQWPDAPNSAGPRPTDGIDRLDPAPPPTDGCIDQGPDSRAAPGYPYGLGRNSWRSCVP